MKKILEVKNLSKEFNNTRVLNNININVNEGEFLAIMGPSGSLIERKIKMNNN